MPDQILEQKALILGLCFALCCLLEHLFPLRPRSQSWGPRLLNNVALAAVSAVLLRLSFYPLVAAIASWSSARSWGIVPQLDLPWLWQILLALLLLDYTLYLWHFMMHKVNFLWRFHNVHHIDLDLDSSTALRFHFGELMLSSFYRSGQILMIGVDPFTLLLFEVLVTSSAQFHHSNLRLPFAAERLLGHILITPRIHGLHHSLVQNETDSNYGALLTVWDRLHRTFRRPSLNQPVDIGVPSYRELQETKLLPSLMAPFQRPRPWCLPDGTVPQRAP